MASTNVPLTALLSGGATGRLSAAARYGNNGSSQFGAPFGQQHHPRSLSQSPGGGAGIRLRPGPVGLARDDTVIGPTSRGGTGATGAEDGPALATGAGGVDRDGPSGSAADEGEPLLFDMSEIGRDGRRSIEEQRQQQQQPHLRGGTGGGGASGSGAASRYGGAGTGSHRGASGARW